MFSCLCKVGYTYLKNKIAGNTNFFINMDNLKAENENLKEENSRLAQELRELEIIKAENDTMKEYLKLTEKYANYQTIPAYIISKDMSNYSNTFVINVGRKDRYNRKYDSYCRSRFSWIYCICNR